MPDPDDYDDPEDDDLEDESEYRERTAADDAEADLAIRRGKDEPDPPGMADTGNESDDSFFTEGSDDDE